LKSPPPGRSIGSNGSSSIESPEVENDDSFGTPLAAMPQSGNSMKGKGYSTSKTPEEMSQAANGLSLKSLDKQQTVSTNSRATESYFGVSDENDPTLGKLNLKSAGDGADDDDDDVPFDFDETPEKKTQKYVPDVSDDSDEDEEEETAGSTISDVRTYGTSPAVGIRRPHLPSTNSTSSSIGQNGGSTSSTPKAKHPWETPYTSEKIRSDAESMGNVQSFVGSISGNTGVDDDPTVGRAGGAIGSIGGVMGDSFRGGSSFTGGRSMLERMAAEEEGDMVRQSAMNRVMVPGNSSTQANN
jgi:hypothetical protein